MANDFPFTYVARTRPQDRPLKVLKVKTDHRDKCIRQHILETEKSSLPIAGELVEQNEIKESA